jgi:preprotein translocase subunit YajC
MQAPGRLMVVAWPVFLRAWPSGAGLEVGLKRYDRERRRGLYPMQGLFGSSGQLLLPLVFFAALYFLMIAPNQRKQKKWQEMLSQLKSGDKVTTNGGIRGVVLTVKDDVVVVKVAPDNVKLEFVKNSIATVTTAEE